MTIESFSDLGHSLSIRRRMSILPGADNQRSRPSMTPDIPTGRLPPVVTCRPALRLLPELVLLVLLAGTAACSASGTPVKAGHAGPGSGGGPADGESFALAAGESRTWTVELAAGEAFRLRAIPRGLDVELRLSAVSDTADAGREVASARGVRGVEDEREELELVAERTGAYRIEVRAAAGSGRCRLEVSGPRPATDLDRRRSEAAAATGRLFDTLHAITARQKDSAPLTEEDRRRLAGRDAETARLLLLWRELGDPGREAALLYARGLTALEERRWEPAGDDLARAAGLALAAGDEALAADAFNDAGRTQRRRGQPETARESFERALALFAEQGRPVSQAETLSNLGGALKDLGDPRAAVARLRDSLALAREAGAETTALKTQVNLCDALQSLHDREQALATCGAAADEARRLEEPEAEAAALNNLGTLYESLGEWEQAVERYRLALDRVRELRIEDWQGRTLYNLGWTLFNLERTAQLADEQASPPHTDLLQEADRFYHEALAIARRRPDAALPRILSRLTLLELRRGRKQEALAFARGALLSAADHAGEEPLARYALGEALRETGDLAGAREQFARSRELHQRRGELNGEAAATLGLARVERAQGNLPAALAQVDAALALIESLRGRVASPDLRASFLAAKQEYHAFKIDVLMALHRRDPQGGHAEAALEANEAARARSLREVLSQFRAELQRGVAPALLEREREASEQLNEGEWFRRYYLQLDSSPASVLPPQVSRKLESAQQEYQRVEEELQRSAPRYAALTQPQRVRLAEIRRETLDGDTLLLEYALGEERSYLWAVTAAGVRSWEIPPRATVEEVAKRLYLQLTERNRNPEGERAAERRARVARADAALPATAGELSDLVLGPVAGELRPGRRLVVVGDGALQYVPFGVLPVPAGAPRSTRAPAAGRRPRLIEHHVVVVLPSASVLSALRRENAERRPPAGVLAVLADPVFSADDRRVSHAPSGGGAAQGAAQLPAEAAASLAVPADPGFPRGVAAPAARPYLPLIHSGREATAISELVPDKTRVYIATGFAASRANALSGRLAGYRLVHFATHGVLDSQRPDQTSLVLSLVDQNGAPLDGHLKLRDIYDLELNADLVVLSACQTALGKEVRGEGLIGLTRGFMHAGATRVVASLWSVEDRATADLMQRFYEGMLARGLTPAEALRDAQLALLRSKWDKPYYWAAFSLQGEWQ
jgi:CHAT domain-containing protein